MESFSAINPLGTNHKEIYKNLKAAHPHLKVFLKEEFPQRFHYGSHPTIPRILALADEGWSISSRSFVAERQGYGQGGNHGFDNQLKSMGALFIARGPAFKSGIKIEPFLNIHIYALMTEILELEPAANDGSLDSVKVVLK